LVAVFMTSTPAGQYYTAYCGVQRLRRRIT
jgi:hypothetical protein